MYGDYRNDEVVKEGSRRSREIWEIWVSVVRNPPTLNDHKVTDLKVRIYIPLHPHGSHSQTKYNFGPLSNFSINNTLYVGKVGKGMLKVMPDISAFREEIPLTIL